MQKEWEYEHPKAVGYVGIRIGYRNTGNVWCVESELLTPIIDKDDFREMFEVFVETYLAHQEKKLKESIK